MPIESIQMTGSKKGFGTFKIGVAARQGVYNAVVYAKAKGAEPFPDEIIATAVQQKTLNNLGAQVIPIYSGQTSTDYAPKSELGYQWVDLFLCELNADGDVIANEYQKTCFYGSCIVGAKIDRFELSNQYDAVQITVKNQSSFDLPANAVAYRAGKMIFTIPVELKKGLCKRLPPISVRHGESVRMDIIEGGYPVEFRDITD